jgi:hypothetical protein
MHEMPRRTNRALWSNPCRRFFLLLALMPIWLGLAGWLGFTDSADAWFVAVVVGFLVVIVVALPWLLYRLLTRDQEPEQESGSSPGSGATSTPPPVGSKLECLPFRR